MANNWNQAIFLTAFLTGDVLLIASFLVARFNWRPDVPPYNLRTNTFDVLWNPAKYVQPKALRMTRSLQVLGGLLLLIAVAALARQLIHDLF